MENSDYDSNTLELSPHNFTDPVTKRNNTFISKTSLGSSHLKTGSRMKVNFVIDKNKPRIILNRFAKKYPDTTSGNSHINWNDYSIDD